MAVRRGCRRTEPPNINEKNQAPVADAVSRLPEIDPERCRARVRERFTVEVVTRAYEEAYRHVIEAHSRQAPAQRQSGPLPEAL